MERHNALVEINLKWLRQAERVLESVGSNEYSQSPRGFEPHRVGAHLRHVIEFYGCFFEGLDRGNIDYDGRRRDQSIEGSRQAAAAAIREITCKFETSARVRADAVVWVRMDGLESAISSIHRELQILSSHTVHHFALIAMTLRAHGVEAPDDFGVAPATLRYQAGRQSEAA
jgi:hypothetical protein